MKNYIQYLAEAMTAGTLDQDDFVFWRNFYRKNRQRGILYSPVLHIYKSFNQ